MVMALDLGGTSALERKSAALRKVPGTRLEWRQQNGKLSGG
jgi:hypothetical protein